MVSQVEADVHSEALRLLGGAGLPFVVAGAYGLRHYTGIERYTKDLDLFMLRRDVPAGLAVLGGAGFETHVLARHWLADAVKQDYLVDLIHGFGNWRAAVDQSWLDRSVPGRVHGVPVRFAPVEEMAWMKAHVAHRERFDGADVVHLIRATARRFDWRRFAGLFGDCWELLLHYLLLFQFVYPSDRQLVPTSLMSDLLDRLAERPSATEPAGPRATRGPLVDRFSYLADVEVWGLADARVPFAVAQGFSPEDIAEDRREALEMVLAGRVRPARVA